MSKKNSAVPPPRPPAPKVGGGLSFSFKALEEEEDEELTSVTGKFDKQVHDEKERYSRERSLSKSPDSRQSIEQNMENSPSIKSQNSFETLKDLKDKIRSEIQKKKEDFFTDSSPSIPKEKDNEIVIEKETNAALRSAQTNLTHETLENSGEIEKSNNELEIETDYFDSKSDGTIVDNSQVNEKDQLEITDEYFNPTGEDFADLPGVVPMVRQRKRFQNIRKIKPIVPPAPMSKLSQNLYDEIDVTEESKLGPDQNEKKDVNNSKTLTEAVATLVPIKKFGIGVVFLLLYLIIPLPSYINGMIIGAVLSSGGWMLYIWIKEPTKPREPLPEDPPLDKLPPLPVPEMREPKLDDCCYKVYCLY